MDRFDNFMDSIEKQYGGYGVVSMAVFIALLIVGGVISSMVSSMVFFYHIFGPVGVMIMMFSPIIVFALYTPVRMLIDFFKRIDEDS